MKCHHGRSTIGDCPRKVYTGIANACQPCVDAARLAEPTMSYHCERRDCWNTVLMFDAWLPWEDGAAAAECVDELNHSNEVRAFHLWGHGE